MPKYKVSKTYDENVNREFEADNDFEALKTALEFDDSRVARVTEEREEYL